MVTESETKEKLKKPLLLSSVLLLFNLLFSSCRPLKTSPPLLCSPSPLVKSDSFYLNTISTTFRPFSGRGGRPVLITSPRHNNREEGRKSPSSFTGMAGVGGQNS